MSTKPEGSLQQIISEQIEYLEILHLSGGLSAEDWSAAIQRHQEIIQSAIVGGPDLQPCHAVALLKLLAAEVLPHEVRLGLTKVVNSKVAAGATSCSPGSKAKEKQQLQVCVKFYLFVTKRIWGVWSDQLSQPAQRIEELVRLADSLGLTNPNESTQKVMTATLLLGMTKGDMQISMTDAKSLLDDIKTCIKLSRKRWHAEHHGAILVYPRDPWLLKGSHPELFARAYPEHSTQPDNAPGGCPFNEWTFRCIVSRLPARRSHASVAAMSLTKPTCQRKRSFTDGWEVDLPGFKWNIPTPAPAVRFATSQCMPPALQATSHCMPPVLQATSHCMPPALQDVQPEEQTGEESGCPAADTQEEVKVVVHKPFQE